MTSGGRGPSPERCAAFSTEMSRMFRATELDVLLRRPVPRTWSPVEYVAHVSEAVPWYFVRILNVKQEAAVQLAALD
jgi:hypothetical protein